MEISGTLSAQEYGHEPELLISSSSAEALGVALRGPSKLAFAAGAGLQIGPTDEMPVLCARVTADMLTQEPSASPTTSPAPTITSAPTAAPTAAPTYGTLSPTEKTFPAVCAGSDETSTLKPYVAAGAFDDADLWTPRGVPSTEAYVEIGALSAHAYGHEPELLVSSAASARGLLLLGPSKLAFSAGAGLYLGETDSMPPLCHNVTTAGLTGIPTTAPTGSQAPTTTFAPSSAPTPLATPSPTKAVFPGICDDATATAVLNPRVASASFVDETVWIPRGVPSVAEFAEVAGGLSAYAFSHEPELVVSADVPRAAWRCTARRSYHSPRAVAFAWARPSPCRRRARSIASPGLCRRPRWRRRRRLRARRRRRRTCRHPRRLRVRAPRPARTARF